MLGLITRLTADDHLSILQLFEDHGSSAAIEAATTMPRRTIQYRLARARVWQRGEALKARGAVVVPTMDVVRVSDTYDGGGELKAFSITQTITPELTISDPEKPLPGFAYKRVSSLRKGDGSLIQEWHIQQPEIVKQWNEIEEAIDNRVARVEPRLPTLRPTVTGPADYLNQVTIADGHVGAMAWGVETGSANWDLGIAQETLLAGACWLMDNLPPAEDLLLIILGDFLDSDGFRPETPASKHLLDVDGRFPKIADVGCQVIENAVNHGLTKYRTVRVVIKPGNHDPLSAYWMRKLISRVFKNEPRVEVEQSIRPYWAMLFGKCMISTHHGDKASLNDLPGIFAADFAVLWGQATYRICHTGHLHHKDIRVNTGKDLRGMTVYQHPTLSSRNAWAAERGYPGDRELLGHNYHRAGRMTTTLHFDPMLLEATKIPEAPAA